MLKDCLEVFEKEFERIGEPLILDAYTPADGSYIIVKPIEDTFEMLTMFDIKQDKKTKEIAERSNKYFKDVCEYDYNSILVDMNKPIDDKKIIQSNNYLSFFIKKESLINGKLTEERINKYYEILEDPCKKYFKSKKSLELYKEVEKEIGQVDKILLSKIKKWILENIFNLGIDVTGKDYLKIFFEYPIETYQREGKRYLIPNIYNNNDFNTDIEESTYGLANNNMGLNSKKPYLENKTRNITVPYLLSEKEVLIQKKFFDRLMSLAAVGRVNIYVDRIENKISGYKNGETLDKDFIGIFLRIKKGKEVEIHDYDIISGYKYKLKKAIKFKNIISLDLNSNNVSTQKYGKCTTLEDIQGVLNEVLFSKFLITNYFTESGDLSINDGCLKNNLLLSRQLLFNWFYKGIDNGVFPLLEKVSLSLMKGSIENGYIVKASHQFNLRWSIINHFEGGVDMKDILEDIKDALRKKINAEQTDHIESDNEFYFAVGQLVNFLLSKSKGKKKPLSLANAFINGKNPDIIKDKLRKLYMKYNYDIEMSSRRFKNLYAMIPGYITEAKVNQDMIIAGYLSSNLIYESSKKEEQN